jgi:hypothetical protein
MYSEREREPAANRKEGRGSQRKGEGKQARRQADGQEGKVREIPHSLYVVLFYPTKMCTVYCVCLISKERYPIPDLI